MANIERYGTRDLTYSAWHRTLNDWLAYIDIDVLETCIFCKDSLALIEIAQDVGQTNKATTYMRKLAEKAGVPAYLVFYKIKDEEIFQLRVQQVSPQWSKTEIMTPAQYEGFLLSLRHSHKCFNISEFRSKRLRTNNRYSENNT